MALLCRVLEAAARRDGETVPLRLYANGRTVAAMNQAGLSAAALGALPAPVAHAQLVVVSTKADRADVAAQSDAYNFATAPENVPCTLAFVTLDQGGLTPPPLPGPTALHQCGGWANCARGHQAPTRHAHCICTTPVTLWLLYAVQGSAARSATYRPSAASARCVWARRASASRLPFACLLACAAQSLRGTFRYVHASETLTCRLLVPHRWCWRRSSPLGAPRPCHSSPAPPTAAYHQAAPRRCRPLRPLARNHKHRQRSSCCCRARRCARRPARACC